MKKFRALAAAIALCLVCGVFTSCSELLFGVDVTIVNDTNSDCKVLWNNQGSSKSNDDDADFDTSIIVKPQSEVIISVEYGSRIKLTYDGYQTKTSKTIYEAKTYRVGDIFNVTDGSF